MYLFVKNEGIGSTSCYVDDERTLGRQCNFGRPPCRLNHVSYSKKCIYPLKEAMFTVW